MTTTADRMTDNNGYLVISKPNFDGVVKQHQSSDVLRLRYNRRKSYILYVLLICIAACAIILIFNWGNNCNAKSLRTQPTRHEGAIVSNGNECSRIGMQIMKQNGSVVDATIAVMLCESIACPQSTGIGGGFVATIYIKRTGAIVSLNSREVAPRLATEDMFANDTEIQGPRSIAVPATLKGLWEMHQRYGQLPWSTVLQPAIELCRSGTVVTTYLNKVLKLYEAEFRQTPALGGVFLNPQTNAVWQPGDRIKRPQLAETLTILADEGERSLYRTNGTIFKRLMADLRSVDSLIQAEDLTEYKVQWSRPESYRINTLHTMYTSPLPATGFLVAFILNVLSGFTLDESALSYHRIIETFKFAFGKRTELGDPKFEQGIQALVDEMLSVEFVSRIRSSIDDNRAYSDYRHYGAKYTMTADKGTTHLNVLAPNGDAVAVTSTLNDFFGSKVHSARTDITLNNQMDDFSSANPNVDGLPGSPANRIVPGKQPISSMTPTIILDNDSNVRLMIGGAGGTKITTAISIALIRHLFLNQSIADMLNRPRFHHQLMPMQLNYEEQFNTCILDELELKGHELWSMGNRFGYGSINLIERDEHGRARSYFDPRRGGSTQVW